ncbi:MAG: cob(I)yrinic acid a,c-diamide adenosyltransferase [Patescibacteria group bacterium]
MLYTRNGDDGTSNLYHQRGRTSKSDPIFDALGTLDELNCWCGIVKTHTEATLISYQDQSLPQIVHDIQENLFIIQAGLAGADKEISGEKIQKMEETINNIEKALPPITTFFVPGGTSLSSHLDMARAITRRAERTMVTAKESEIEINELNLQYINRLSSLFYALVRITNHHFEQAEEKPHY